MRGRNEVDGPDRIDLSGERGLREAWAAHADELLGRALHALGDREAAEEALQETFVRAWRGSGHYDSSRPLRPWLYAILRNVVIDQIRARSVRPAAAGPAAEDGTDGVDPIEASLDGWILEEALDRIPEHHRVVLVETLVKGRPYGEVAGELGIPVGTARSRAYYALRALRVVLEEMGWEP